jgi:hypothetical protein
VVLLAAIAEELSAVEGEEPAEELSEALEERHGLAA